MASIISAGTTAGTSLNLTGDTTGNLAFQTQAGANTITVPNGTGTVAVQGVSTNIVSGTAVASTSGTSIDFTGIPSWAKRITIMFNGVSHNSASQLVLVQIGAGSVTTSGYTSGVMFAGGASSAGGANPTNGFGVANSSNAADLLSGAIFLTTLGSNIWVSSGTLAITSSAYAYCFGGNITLGGTLDRVRITTSAGTATFDAGSINILYE